MAILSSPGVDVQIINESFYASAGPGTVPLIVIATAANKPSPSGTGAAPYTLPSMAGKLAIATSQRDLLMSFGNPIFHSVQGTPLHCDERNEFGLHAAYQYLGINNMAYVLRADIDLAQLASSDSAPRGPAVSGTYWLDLGETAWGVFQSNGSSLAGSAWEVQPVKVAMEANCVEVNGIPVPATSYGSNGDFAVVPLTAANFIYEKINGAWYEISSNAWKAARPTMVLGAANPQQVTVGDAITINGTVVTFTAGDLASVVSAIVGAAITNITAETSNGALLVRNTAGGDIQIANSTGTPLATLGITAGTYKGVRTFWTNDAQYPAGSVAGDVWIKGTSPNKGSNWKVKRYDASIGQWYVLTAPHYPFRSALSDADSLKDEAARLAMAAPAAGTIYVGYDKDTGARMLRRWTGSMWEGLVYEADFDTPTTDPEDGTMWFNADFRVDIMYGDGTKWMGYRRKYPDTDPAGVIISGSAPLTQSDGTPLVDYDLWLESSDLENYPRLYRYDAAAFRWRLIDNTDATTPFGIIFADARANSGVAFTGMPNAGAYAYSSEVIADMLVSDYLDPDAPDPRVYPDGMLLFNTRYSTYNVKAWRPHYFEDGQYDPNTNYTIDPYTVGADQYEFPALASPARWVTVSGNRHDGAPYMGRKAQRIMVVRAMSAAVQQSSDLRSELLHFNLMSAPGYPELIDELLALNVEQKETAFVVADTPARMAPNASAIQAWATNANLAPSNGEEGLTSTSEYCAVYYPWGLSNNVDGTEVMVPPSTIALRTLAYNDQVAYPWFAPAGFERGLVTNAATVGYLTSESEFQPVLLNPGQRDILYQNKINPIAFIPGRGLVVYGQKTLSPNVMSALDRINVARLANYLKYHLDNIMKQFLFEQNDDQTRGAAKSVVERFLSGLVGLRAIDDYAVLCNLENNTPERIDRNELWVDIALRPIKAIEFIYVPIRIRNTGASLEFNT